jgi:hypothetical protein
MDPMPEDCQARVVHKRFYQQLHEVLELPPPADSQSTNPLR